MLSKVKVESNVHDVVQGDVNGEGCSQKIGH